MKKLILSVILVALALPALGDGTGTYIKWPGWTVTSTEDVYIGHKHTSFPLTYLLDDDPATAWVFSGTGEHWDGATSGYAITLTRDENKKPVIADSIHIMNGYNKSRDLFLRNNRITQLKLYLNNQYLKTVTLSDKMGWHNISIPRKPVKELTLSFTGFAKGRDNDVCVSEIALYNGSSRVALKMPKAVIYTPGSDCGCGQEFYLLDRSGQKLASHDLEFCFDWSSSGRYVAGSGAAGGKTCDLWVADMLAGKVIMCRSFCGKDDSICSDLVWKGEHTVSLDVESLGPNIKLDEYHRGKIRTISINVKANR